MATKRITVIEERDSGRNELFRDNTTGRTMSRSKLVSKIKNGEYPKYLVRVVNGLETPVSNPDHTENNNLG